MPKLHPGELRKLRASNIKDKFWQCERKKQYRTAKGALRAIQTHFPVDADRYNAYECPHCAGWHIGRKTLSKVEASSSLIPTPQPADR